MREQAGASVGAGDESAGGALFIITLSSSTTPMALDVPSLAELAGLAVFRSRKVEDGRDRFRLHLGYFESAAAAEHVLPTVREHFPAAWVGPAPNSGMGSLDDTSVAQFKFIKAPNTIKSDGGTSTRLRALTAAGAPAPKAAAPRTAAASHVPTVSDVVAPHAGAGQPAVAKNPAAPKNPATRPETARSDSRRGASKGVPPRLAAAMRAASPAKALSSKASLQRAVPSKPAPQARASLTPPRANAPVAPTAPPAPAVKTSQALAPKEVLNLLESRTAGTRAGRQEQMQPRERAAVIGAIQRFAVQLIWSTDPLNLAEVPKLAIFDAYTLYKVQVDRAGRRWYGLRLGFFGDAVSARQVAIYARSDFSAAAVVPVSDRECDRAAQAAVKELPDQPAAPKAEVEMELIDVPRGGPKVDIGLQAPRARPVAVAVPLRPSQPPTAQVAASRSGAAQAGLQAAGSQTAASSKAKPQSATSAQKASAGPTTQSPGAHPPAQEKTEKTRRLKTTADLAAELKDAEPEFELVGDEDALNDTGVRHLAIQIVGKKQSGLGKLFKRRR